MVRWEIDDIFLQAFYANIQAYQATYHSHVETRFEFVAALRLDHSATPPRSSSAPSLYFLSDLGLNGISQMFQLGHGKVLWFVTWFFQTRPS